MLHEVWLPVLLVAFAALLALLAALRLGALNRHVREPRLARLTWFFLLFSLALAVLVSETLLLASETVRAHEALTIPVLLFWLRHALLLAALVAAVLAVGAPHRTPRQEAAPLGVALVQLAHPLLLLLQGLLLFYLVVRSAVNHARRAEPGSLRVALGFLLLLAAHLSPFLTLSEGPPPLGAGDLLSSVFLLLGTLVLATIVYRRASPRAAEPGARRDDPA